MTSDFYKVCEPKFALGLLKYMLRLQDFYQFRKETGMGVEEFKNFIRNCTESYHVFCVKQVLWSVAKNKPKSIRQVYPLFQKAELPPEDIELFKLIRPYLPLVKTRKVKLIESPRDVRKRCEEFFKHNTSFIQKFVYRKQKFIAQYNNMSYEDLVGELKIAGIRAAYKASPFYVSQAHLDNIMRQSIHNCGVNIIAKYTTQKRARIISTTESDYMQTVTTDETELNNIPDETDRQSYLEGELSVQSILNELEGPEKLAVELLSGKDNKYFTEHCQEIDETITCTEDAMDSLKGRFKWEVRKFTNIKYGNFNDLLNRVERKIA
jgi:hypothetical protein